MRGFLNKNRHWLFPAVLILFVLEVITFSIAVDSSWAGRSESPDRTLVYKPGKLTWKYADSINEEGVAELSMFKTMYPNIKSSDGSKIVAPGTSGGNIVRLKNEAGRTVQYTAVLYRIRSSEKLPVNAVLGGDNFKDTETYILPKNIQEAEVIRAVTGELGEDLIQDFDISWSWKHADSEEQDEFDTWLATISSEEGEQNTVTVGLYITVNDNFNGDTNGNANGNNNGNSNGHINGNSNGHTNGNNYITPEIPYTGDSSMIGMLGGLIMVSLAVLLLLIVDRNREKACKK